MHIFDSIEHVQSLVAQWIWVYNNEQPHSSIGGIPHEVAIILNNIS